MTFSRVAIPSITSLVLFAVMYLSLASLISLGNLIAMGCTLVAVTVLVIALG